MEIIYHINSLYNPGGMERVTLNKVQWWVEKEVEVVVVTTDQCERPTSCPFPEEARMVDFGIKVYNVYSSSQSLMESALYYEKLPDGVKTIIQCIDEREFDLKSMTLTTPAKLAFSMAGYKVGEFCSSLLTAEDLKEIGQNPIIRNFKARTALKTGLSHIVVKALDEDAPGEGIYRVDYPYMYPSDSAMTYERDLALLKQFIPSPGHVFTVPEELKTFIHIGVEYLSSRDIEVVYVLMPLSPALGWTQETKIRKSQSVNETVEPNGFIDCLDILSSTDFYDPVHPNRKGSKKITNQIMDYLSEDSAKK